MLVTNEQRQAWRERLSNPDIKSWEVPTSVITRILDLLDEKDNQINSWIADRLPEPFEPVLFLVEGIKTIFYGYYDNYQSLFCENKDNQEDQNPYCQEEKYPPSEISAWMQSPRFLSADSPQLLDRFRK